MKNENEPKDPKWEAGQTVHAGKQAHELGMTYKPEIEPRMKPDELNELKLYVEELESKRSGQSKNLTNQKSKTRVQNITMEELHQDVMDTRNQVKSTTYDGAIHKAFGIGEKVRKTVSSVIAAGTTVLDAYNQYQEWATTEAGILEQDMAAIQAGMEALGTADDVQEQSMVAKKVSTMDKNTLQREVEDKVTKISAVGVKAFRKKNPSVARLFEGLIPS